MEKILSSTAALAVLLGLASLTAAQEKRFEPHHEIHRDDIVGRIERVRVDRDGDVHLWLRRTDYLGRRLEGRGFDKEVEIKGHEAHCWIFEPHGMREVNVKACEGRVMNVQWRTVRGRDFLELHEMRRPVR